MKDLLRIYKIMMKYWGFVIGGLISMLFYALMGGVSIAMMIPLLDYVFVKNKPVILYPDYTSFIHAMTQAVNQYTLQYGSLLRFRPTAEYAPLVTNLKGILNSTDSMILLYSVCYIILGLYILKNIFYYSNRIMFTNLRGKTIRDIRSLMFGKYLSQSLAFFNQNKVGDSLVRMVNDVEIVSNQFINNLFNSLRDVFSIFIYIRLALFLNAHLFLWCLLILPLFTFLVTYIGKKLKLNAKKIQSQFSSMFNSVEEALNGMRIVKAFSRENYEYGKFHKINNRYFRLWRTSDLLDGLNVPIAELNTVIIGVVIVFIGGSQILGKTSTFSFGEFTAFLFAVFSMLQPTKNLTKAYNDIKRALVSLDRISVILNRQSEIQEAPDAIEKKDFTDCIEFKDVSFSYTGKKEVLSRISFDIMKGQKVAIIGSSGSGKTTITNLLNRMYDYDSGEITIDSIPIRRIKLHDLRDLYGVVTQESLLFSDTVRNNICYGSSEPVSDEQLKKACEIASATEFIEKMPDQYDEELQTKGSNLSGGQKQRLCIARAIVGDPPILIFDEATSSLDTDSERKVQDAIDRATQNRTVIVIAHRLSTILSANKIVVLEHGKIVGIGKHDDLLENCERYKQLYKLQFEMK
ncbi:MAG TPA: ABC transporter ATP-binding protein [Candidatus Cloacimonadota bacterium]|nr:ABC transporter ATP-binding protein [Candidatus Cloacimonadota bacterium]